MKALVVLLALLTATPLSGVGAVTVRIKAYNATGEVDIRSDPFTLGTRVLLTCDVTGLPEGSEVVSHRWYHNCAGGPDRPCEIEDGDPYYRVVEDNLLVDVTSLDQGGRYYCNADSLPVRDAAITRQVAVADNPAPFLYTPTSLLPEHSVLTDVQQATGMNGQQWITCRSGGEGTRPEIWMGSKLVVNSNTANSAATIELGIQHLNGLYHCLSEQSQTEYFSLFFTNSATLPTPSVQNNSSVWNFTSNGSRVENARDISKWTLTSPDGSRVEGYIVEFECRVRSITFVEKYTSVSASEGTGQVATNVSCFGGLGQLYRVKVWAVSGPRISRALVCHIPDGQCREEEGGTRTPTTTTPVSKGTTTLENTGGSLTTPTGPQTSNTAHSDVQFEGGPFIGVGLCLLLVVLALVASIVVAVVVVKRRGVNKQTESIKMGGNPCYNNPAVVEEEEKDVGAEYENTVKNKENGSVAVGLDSYEDVDSKAHDKNAKTPPPKESSTPGSATNVGELYAVVDKSKKKKAKNKGEENGSTLTNKDDLYTVSVKKDKMPDEEIDVRTGAEKSEDSDEVAEHKYEPKADSQPGQQSEGEEKSSNVDMLYAVVDKSRKKKK